MTTIIRQQAERPMRWGKRVEPRGSDVVTPTGEKLPPRKEIKRELDLIRASAQEAFDSRRRFWFYPMLTDVYRFFTKVKKIRRSKKCAQIAAAHYGINLDDDPIRVFIDVVTPGPVNNKSRRRWAVGLRKLWKRKVSPEGVDAFFKANGGIAGCARL
jgi:hypothetical protein